jgi:hypothetical protein
MSTIIVAAILVGAIVAVCVVLISIHNKQKRKAMNKILQYFSEAGARHDLNFSSQEVLKDCIIGLDGRDRKLLVVTRREEGFHSVVIDLDEIKKCTVQKVFGAIKANDLKNKKLEQYLEKITLHFEFKNNRQAIEVVFYKHFDNHLTESFELESKARHWQAILSKMELPLKSIA